MTYRVIKKIKGHSYLYEQSSYRIGEKVKTKSRYLGPVSPSGVRDAAAAPYSKEPKQPEAAFKAQIVGCKDGMNGNLK